MEATIIVCDVCEKPAATSVTFTVNGSNKRLQKDLCDRHLTELKAGSHTPRRGRPRVS